MVTSATTRLRDARRNLVLARAAVIFTEMTGAPAPKARRNLAAAITATKLALAEAKAEAERRARLPATLRNQST